MRRTLICLLLFACCGSAFAMAVFPPAPDSQTFVKIATQTPFCAVSRTDVAIEGSTITLTVVPLGGVVCAATFFPLQASVGVVPAGVYDVNIKLFDGPVIERSRMIVRDASSGIIVSPVGGRSEGGRTVQIFGAQIVGDTLVSVLFDGIPAGGLHLEHGSLVVIPPAHAPGTVDVTVTDLAGTRKAVAAFTYFDPNAAPDPFVFEPLLYPVAYDGPGVFGSQWTTNNVMGTGRTLARFREGVAARTCTATCSQFDWAAVLAPESQSGLLLWAVRRRLPVGAEDDFRVSSRIVDTSQPHGNGTSLPVARENDFRDNFSIDGVPIGGSARVTLRLYSPVDSEQNVTVSVVDINGSASAQGVTLRPVNGVAYASVDLGAASDVRSHLATISVISAGAKVWGVATVTDNTTQEVTAFWPQ
jgi:hypothetical protein